MYRLLLLCCALCGAVCSGESLTETVKAVVANTNSYMAEHNLTQLPLPDFADEGSLHRLQIANSRIGNFSTTELKEILFINRTTLANGTEIYIFDVVLGLNPAEISYDFLLTVEGLFPMSGKLRVTAHSNSYQVRGSILAEGNSSCEAILDSCSFKKLKDFKVQIHPKTVSYISIAKKHLLDVITPHYLPRINKGLEDIIHKPTFQQVFSTIVCKNIQK